MVGIAHVGLGLDTVYDRSGLAEMLTGDNKALWPEAYSYTPDIKIMEPEELPRITDALLTMDYSDEDVQKVLGLNLLRVAKQTWK